MSLDGSLDHKINPGGVSEYKFERATVSVTASQMMQRAEADDDPDLPEPVAAPESADDADETASRFDSESDDDPIANISESGEFVAPEGHRILLKPTDVELAQLQKSIRKLRPKASLPSPRVARLFKFLSGRNGWELGKFRRHYT